MNPRVADTVAHTLHAHGIRRAFGMPGGEVTTLIDGLTKAGIAFHLARHETAAAIMAAGTAVIGAAPGLLVTTVGPGLANAVNGIADASQEHAPLIVISGVVDRNTRARYTHQVIDQKALLHPLVKASFEIEPESAGPTVARALAIALTEPMGPVHLDLSPAVAAMLDPAPRVVAPVTEMRSALRPDDAGIAAIAARLAGARRPLILAGFEAARSGAGPGLLKLAEKIGAPIITTYKAKGVTREDHALSLGGAGLSPAADAILLRLIADADVVLAFGYDPIEMRLGWLDLVDSDALIEFTRAASDHAMHRASLRLIADTAAAAEALAAVVPMRDSWPNREPAEAKAALTARFRRPADWGPHVIIETLNAALDDEAIVTVDSGAHRILLSQKWCARRPLALLQSAGFCTMAAALPLAIGAKIAAPQRRTVAVMGDGGLEMGLGELATLRDLALPITLVVFQDCSLALIALKQAASGLAPNGVALGETDFAAVARAFGGYGCTVETVEALRAELTESATRDRFTLIACRFDKSAYDDAF